MTICYPGCILPPGSEVDRLVCSAERTRWLLGWVAEIGSVTSEQLPVNEATACRPTTAYGASKHALVQAALAEPIGSGLEVVVARPFNLLGLV